MTLQPVNECSRKMFSHWFVRQDEAFVFQPFRHGTSPYEWYNTVTIRINDNVTERINIR